MSAGGVSKKSSGGGTRDVLVITSGGTSAVETSGGETIGVSGTEVGRGIVDNSGGGTRGVVATTGGGKGDVVITGGNTIVDVVSRGMIGVVVIRGIGAVRTGGGTKGVEERTGGERIGVIRHGAVRTKDSPGAREVERASIRVCISSHSET